MKITLSDRFELWKVDVLNNIVKRPDKSWYSKKECCANRRSSSSALYLRDQDIMKICIAGKIRCLKKKKVLIWTNRDRKESSRRVFSNLGMLVKHPYVGNL